MANTWGYGAMTNSYNDIQNSKCIFFIGGNPAEAHPVSMLHMLRAKERNRRRSSSSTRASPARRRTPTEFVRFRPGTDVPLIFGHALAHLRERLGGQGVHPRSASTAWTSSAPRSKKWTPDEVEDVTGAPGEPVRRVAETHGEEQAGDADLVHGRTQHTVGNANVRASCILQLALGNIGVAGGGANIYRGHDNVQGATDMGLNVTTLPAYYGLDEGAWKHWSRVWDVTTTG